MFVLLTHLLFKLKNYNRKNNRKIIQFLILKMEEEEKEGKKRRRRDGLEERRRVKERGFFLDGPFYIGVLR